jgi:hypothetical protein
MIGVTSNTSYVCTALDPEMEQASSLSAICSGISLLFFPPLFFAKRYFF